jgi:hypothetical protein
MKKNSLKFLLQEQPRTPEGLLIQSFLRQQQQGFDPDPLGGKTFLEIVRSNAGAATITSTALSIANLTGKLLIVYSIGAVGGGTISCQIQSCLTGGASPASVGAAFGTAAGPGQFLIDLESFTNTFIRAVATIVTGPTPVCIIGIGTLKLV